MTSLRKLPLVVYFLFLCAGLVSAAVGAHALRADETRQVSVRIDDLNPATPAGVAAIYNRIERAAREACGSDDLSGLQELSAEWRGCVRAAVGRAVRDVDAPLLSSYSAQRQHGPAIAP